MTTAPPSRPRRAGRHRRILESEMPTPSPHPRAPKARPQASPGHRPGWRRRERASPARAGHFVTPLQGWGRGGAGDPGRCPGLACGWAFGPAGRRRRWKWRSPRVGLVAPRQNKAASSGRPVGARPGGCPPTFVAPLLRGATPRRARSPTTLAWRNPPFCPPLSIAPPTNPGRDNRARAEDGGPVALTMMNQEGNRE